MPDTNRRRFADVNAGERLHIGRCDPRLDPIRDDVTIRPCHSQDAEQARHLAETCTTMSCATPGDTSSQQHDGSETVRHCWVAEWHGQIIGLAILQFDDGGAVARLRELTLDATWRGRHIACALLRTAVERASDQGCLKLILEARLVLQRVTELLRRLGFRKAGDTCRRDKRPPQFYLDLYQKPSGRDGIAELVHEPQPDASIVPDITPHCA